MKIVAAMLGAAVLLSGAGVSYAQENVQSKLTLALVVSVTTAQPGDDEDTKITKLRFGTKDFLDLMPDGAQTLVLERTTTLADTIPANTDFLSEPILLLDDDGGDVAESDAIVQVNLDVVGLATATGLFPATAIKDDGNLHVSRKDVFVDAATWTLDANNDDSSTTDQAVLDLIGTVTATSKRKTVDGDDAGLFLTGWSVPVTGGLHLDNAITTFGTGDVDGVLSGTIKVGGEKVLVAP